MSKSNGRTKRKPIEYMKFFWRDFNRDTGHLTRAQGFSYLQIMCAYYDNHGPIHERVVARSSCATIEEWEADRDVIAEFFTIDTSGMWKHKRIEIELKGVRTAAEISRKGGIKSGETRRAQKAEIEAHLKSTTKGTSTSEGTSTTEDVRRNIGEITTLFPVEHKKYYPDRDTLSIMDEKEREWQEAKKKSEGE